MRTLTTFTIQDYEGQFNLLKQEKGLIILALNKTKGNIKEAHKLLCPQPKPHYSLSYIQTQVKRHEIDIIDIRKDLRNSERDRNAQRESSESHRQLVQKNLKNFENRYGFKLRSAE